MYDSSMGASNFSIYVDSRSAVGVELAAEISFDFDGDGRWDRTETYKYGFICFYICVVYLAFGCVGVCCVSVCGRGSWLRKYLNDGDALTLARVCYVQNTSGNFILLY